jgi:hypothetical protein
LPEVPSGSKKRAADGTPLAVAKKPKVAKAEQLECSIGVCTTGKKTYFTCKSCNASTCLSCFATGMTEHKMDIQCPSCNANIPESTWRWVFPPHYVNSIIRKRTGFKLVEFYDANRGLFQDNAAAEKDARALRTHRDTLRLQAQAKRAQMKVLRDELAIIDNLSYEASKSIRIKESRRDARPQGQPHAAAAAASEPERVTIVRQVGCFTANCRAFLDGSGHCNICGLTYCLTCQSLEHRDAPCNSDTLATLTLIAAEYKPCPNPACGVPIKRVSGCPQMFCLLCHTFFDENTRKIVTGGVLHNPDFFALLNRGGVLRGTAPTIAAAEGDGCGMPNFQNLRRQFPELAQCNGMVNFIQSINHLVATRANDADIETQQRIKIQGMLIDSILSEKAKTDGRQVLTAYPEEAYRSDLVRCCKASQYAKDLNSLLATTCTAGIDLIRSLQGGGAFAEVYEQVKHLAELTNEEIVKLAEFYQYTPKGRFILNPGNIDYLSFE